MQLRAVYNNVKAFARSEFGRAKKKYFKERQMKYIRVCCGFDIETTRIEDRAYMYHWQFAWDDVVIVGRRWDQYAALVAAINKWLSWQNATLICWVANLGHEFEFLCGRFEFKRIFAIDAREPLRAAADRIEYRECLSISGQGGLYNLSKNYTETKKLIGDLDYEIIRNSQTPLTNNELQYCLNDVIILSEWADYCFRSFTDKGIEIPLTSTGIVRNAVRKAAAETGHIWDIRAAVKTLYPSRDVYNLIMRYLFRGGYTHASAWWIFVVWGNVIGADFTSSYPAVMLHELYPMSPFTECTLETDGIDITDKRIDDMCCWFMIDFFDVEQTTIHSIESEHKIIDYRDATFDNGRLRTAASIRVLLTEVDWKIYKMFYKWSRIEIKKAFCAFKGKLPKYLIRPMMESYQTKVRLKRQKLSKTIEYINAKAAVNSYYGMTVTRLNFIEWRWDQELKKWIPEHSQRTYSQMIAKQILSPYWGIYVTAYGRYCLASVIKEMDQTRVDNNVIYCDTDSVYFDDTPRNREIIMRYNAKIAKMNEELPEEFSDIGCFEWIDPDDAVESPTHYTFKTLGAKRYLKWYRDQTGWHSETTVAGMRKYTLESKVASAFVPKDQESWPLHDDLDDHLIGYVGKDKLFDEFSDGLLLSCYETHKSAAVYRDQPGEAPYEDTVTDADGRTELMHEETGVAIVPVTFKIKMDEHYIMLLDILMQERRLPVWA